MSQPAIALLPAGADEGQILVRPALANDREVACKLRVAPLRPKRRPNLGGAARLWQVRRLRVVADVADRRPRFYRGAPTWRGLAVAATRRSVADPRDRHFLRFVGTAQPTRICCRSKVAPIDATVGRRTDVVSGRFGRSLACPENRLRRVHLRSADGAIGVADVPCRCIAGTSSTMRNPGPAAWGRNSIGSFT